MSLGASRAVDVSGEDDLSAQVAVDILIECSGAPQALIQGMKCLSPAGVAVAVGMASADDLLVPMSVIQSKELTLTGTFRYANTYPVAISLAAAGRVDLDACVTGYYPLEETEAAFLAAKSDPRVLKCHYAYRSSTGNKHSGAGSNASLMACPYTYGKRLH